MKKSMSLKLILSYLVVAFIPVLVVSVAIRLNSGQSLANLVVEQQTSILKETVQNYYAANGTMDGFYDYFVQTNLAQTLSSQPGSKNGTPQQSDLRGLHGLVDTENHALIPTLGYSVGETIPDSQIKNTVAVQVEGVTIARILQDTNSQVKLSPEEEQFLSRTNLAIGFAALAGVVVAVVMGYLFASGQLKPIRRLTEASKQLSQGHLNQQVPVTSQDELGQLSATFNKMSDDLARAEDQRKRLTADITHDLSTPIQIISGYLEMVEEEKVVFTPERIEIVRTELDHLRRLVGDLGTLTQVESGGLEFLIQPTDPAALLKSVFLTYQPIAARQGVELVLDIEKNLPDLPIDEGRTAQVLKNLIENALRFTHRGEKITLKASGRGPVLLQVIDTGSGIDAEDLPYVFDRFYKADKARGGNPGKMGLGLAICKALVTAQNGDIYAESKGKGEGTTMTLRFSPEAKR